MGEELKVIIKAEIGNLKKNMEDAKAQIAKFKEQVQKASGDVDGKFKKMGESIKNGIKTAVTATVASITAMVTALVGITQSTEEFRENQSKLATAFQSAGGSAESAKKTYNDLYRVLGDNGQATEASAHLAKLTTNQKELSQWTTICKGIYATFGDSLPIEGLTEASNETARTGQVTGVLADALNWSAKSGETFGVKLKENTKANKEWNDAVNACTTAEDYFNLALQQCNNESEREKLIRQTLSGMYDTASEKYDKNNAKVLAQRDAQLRLQETLAKVGSAFQPVITMATNFANDALAKIAPHIQSFAENYLPVIQSLLTGILNALSSAFTFVSQYYPILIGIATVIGIITTAIGLYNVVSAVKTAMDVAQVTTLGALISAYMAQAVAMMVALAPYILIVAAIGAVIAIIVLCIKHWDKIKATVTNVAKIVKEKVVAMVNAVKEKFNAMKSAIGTVIDNIKSTVSSKFNAVKNTITTIITAIKSVVSTIFGGIKSTISTVINGIKTHISLTFSLIKAIFTGDFGAVKGIVSNIFNNIKNTISKVMDGAKNTVKNVIDKIKGFFNFKWSLPKLKMPKISISGKFSINPPSVPKFSIKWHKLGGVFDNPTLFNYGNSLHGLGEDGAEAIVPLEKNTQWLNKIAERLSEKQGNTPIILQVDGKTFAQISVDSINSLTKQTGKLPIKLA